MRVRKATPHRTRIVKSKNAWDRACTLTVERTSPCGFYAGPIDRGVNYFVLMLEQLGAIPHYSCEGHPSSFYVLFEAPLNLAEQIVECGYFSVELEAASTWSIRTRQFETDAERIMFLRYAAEAWEKKLGPLKALKRR